MHTKETDNLTQKGFDDMLTTSSTFRNLKQHVEGVEGKVSKVEKRIGTTTEQAILERIDNLGASISNVVHS